MGVHLEKKNVLSHASYAEKARGDGEQGHAQHDYH